MAWFPFHSLKLARLHPQLSTLTLHACTLAGPVNNTWSPSCHRLLFNGSSLQSQSSPAHFSHYYLRGDTLGQLCCQSFQRKKFQMSGIKQVSCDEKLLHFQADMFLFSVFGCNECAGGMRAKGRTPYCCSCLQLIDIDPQTFPANVCSVRPTLLHTVPLY